MTGVQEPQSASSALEAWVQTRLAGNLDDWNIEGPDAERVSFRGQSGFTFAWEEARSRTDTALSNPPIDDQVTAALNARPIHAALAECACSRPHEWLIPISRKALPEHEFRHTRVETCDSCSGRKTVNCGGCGASGRVHCGNCSGSGTDRVLCRGCGGMGYFSRTRMGPNNQTEHYRDTCWGCGGGGRINESCRPCGGSGNVACGRCRGTGQITCSDCQGRGSRLYLYVRRALVDGRSGLALEEIAFGGWADILRANWPTLVTKGAIAFSEVRAKEEQASDVLRINFLATANAARGTVKSGEVRSELYSVGSDSPIVDGEPFLARALGLPDPEDEVDWVASTEDLAGKRLLREAIDVTEEKATTHKGQSKDSYQAAQIAEVREEMAGRYGALIGAEGATSLGNMVMKGIEPLKDRVATKRWRKNLGIAALLGVASAIAIIINFPYQDAAGADWRESALVYVGGIFVASLVWALIARLLLRRELKQLSRKLDLTNVLHPPRHGWTTWGTSLSICAAFTVAIAILYASSSSRLPSGFAAAVENQIQYANATDDQLKDACVAASNSKPMASLYPCRRLCKNPANKMECLMGFGDSDGPPIGTEDKYR